MTVEGHLYATEDQTVTLRALDHTLILRRGDRICHGHSVKFHRPEFVDAVCAFGFELDVEWIDAVWQYGLFLFTRAFGATTRYNAAGPADPPGR